MRICVITDNAYIYNEFNKIIVNDDKNNFEFFYSEKNTVFSEIYKNDNNFKAINLKKKSKDFFDNYDLFFSLHCKQLFPDLLVNNYRCINVHPGFNPYNRGWFPQVFSIINKKPVGVTIHEMDTELDHGPVIIRKEIDINEYETSKDVYNRVLQLEIELLRENLDNIIDNNYITFNPEHEGNLNTKKDFDNLCRIDLSKQGTFGEFIDLLRSTTFDGYDNAYFVDSKGNKIYISISLKKDD